MEATPTPTRGVLLELGGKKLYIRFSIATRRRLIGALGGEDKLKSLSGDQISTVVLEGVRAGDPDVTKEWLEEEIDMQNISYVVEKLSEAMGQKKAALTISAGEHADRTQEIVLGRDAGEA